MAKNLPAWKKGLAASLILSVTAVLFVFLRNFNEDTLDNLLKVRGEYLLIAAVMVFLLWIIEGLRIRMLVRTFSDRVDITLFKAMQVYLLTYFFASVTPWAAGEWPTHIYALSRHGLSLGESSAITLARSFLTKFLFTVTAIVLFAVFRGNLVPTFLNGVFAYAVFISAITVLALLIILWKPMLLNLAIKKIGSLPCGKYLFKKPVGQKAYLFLGREMQEFFHSTRSFNRFKWGNLLIISLLTVAFWSCFFSIAPIILLGLNEQVPFLQSLLWQIVIQMIVIYVPVPGGSGVTELSLATLFAYFVPTSVLGIFLVAWRFFTYFVSLFSGCVVALGHLRP